MTADRPDDEQVWTLGTQAFLQILVPDLPDLPDEADDGDADGGTDPQGNDEQRQDTRSEYRVDGEDLR